MPILLYFAGPNRLSYNWYVSCFLTEKTPLIPLTTIYLRNRDYLLQRFLTVMIFFSKFHQIKVICMVKSTKSIPLSIICTGYFKFSSLKYRVWWTGFFPSLKPTGYFFHFKLDVFSSFWARVKYFDGSCLTIYSNSTIYRDIHYQFWVWWIHYSHCCESKRWKRGKF